jgi:carboxyl-terminal processing protease
VLYGGRGIEPDIRVSGNTASQLRARLNEAAFFFVRQLVAGRVNGLESFRVDHQSFSPTVQPGDLVVNEKILEAFRNFAIGDKENGLSAENITSQSDYAKMRIREELATANFSNEAGIQVLLESDPQVLKATESMAEAKKLVDNVAWNRK